MAKDRYWFEHDSNAHSDPLIIKLRMHFGLEGYGAFWILIESLRDSKNYKIENSTIEAICFEYRIKEECFDYMIEIGLFETDDSFFWSESLCRRMIKWDKKKEMCKKAGKLGGLAKVANAKANALANALPRTEQNRTEQNKTKERKNKKKKYPEDFETFRKSYPPHRLGGKIQDYKSWQVAIKSGMMVEGATDNLNKWKNSQEWKKDGGKYIVAISKWLRDGYWETEPSTQEKQVSRYPSLEDQFAAKGDGWR